MGHRLLLLTLWLLGISAHAVADGQQPISARSARGVTAWAVPRQLDQVCVTEIWTEDRSGSRAFVGTLPGGVEALSWNAEGDRLLLTDRPLELAMIGLSIVPRRSQRLCEQGSWELDLESRRLKETEDAAAPEPGAELFEEETAQPFEPRSVGALQGVGTAFGAAALAYSTVHIWDLGLAEDRYKQAAQRFEGLPGRYGQARLFRAAVDRYAEALKQRARDVDDWGRRLVCREHLTVIGDLLAAYAAAHEGERPATLGELKAWVAQRELTAGDREVLLRLFRSPADPEEGRPISYEMSYRPDAAEGEAVVTSHFHAGRLVELVASGQGYRTVDRPVTRAQVDSLLTLGVALTEPNPRRAIQTLEVLAGVAPDFAMGHDKLGYAYLEVRNLRRAIRSFERAVDCDHRLAEAYFGLGLAYRQWPRGNYDAIRYFQKALQYKRDYIAARFNIAELRHEMKEHDARRDLEKLFDQAPTYAPALMLMGKWHEEFARDYEQAAVYYAQYMSLRPGDPEGPYRLGRVYLKTRDYRRVYDMLQGFVEAHPGQPEALPILAQACARLDMPERAEGYWQRYLERVSAGERAPYEDIRLLATKAELAGLAKVTGTDREAAWLARFWQEKDPDLTTAVNERRMEHWRRVWFARQNFSEGMAPWDQRGEIYVRFGEPDHRSRSDEPSFAQSLDVQRVKERLARELYGNVLDRRVMMASGVGPDAAVLDVEAIRRPSVMTGSYPGPVYPVRSLRMDISEAAGFSAAKHDWGSPFPVEGLAHNPNLVGITEHETTIEGAMSTRANTYGPVTGSEDATIVPWESWVYVDLQGGIEITFTDEMANGIFDYAPAPMGADIPSRQQTVLTRLNPKVVTERAIGGAPDHYAPPEIRSPLGFYYDLATFRDAETGATRVEVYAAVPRRAAQYDEQAKETRLDVVRTVGLLNEATGAVYRQTGGITFRGKGDLTGDATALVPDRTALRVPPGPYRLEVRAEDDWLKREAHYRQVVVVEAYGPDSLKMSDIQMAWRIRDAKEENAFVKGDLEVVPLPTRTYDRGSGVFAYYEIYNLSRDTFGRTHYRVTYDVRSRHEKHSTGVISLLARLDKGQRKVVAVSYDRNGEAATEVEYVELKLSPEASGQQVLTVTVEDLNSGEKTEKEAGFIVGG